MKTDTPQTVYLKDYTLPAFWIDTVDLDFVIEAGGTTVTATLALRRNAERPGQPLVLDGEDLQTLAVTVDGKSWPFSESATTLTLADLPDACTLQTIVRIDPDNNTRLSGLYRSKDGYFTQCEAQGFRRITWFLDRPDVMATYTVTLHADRATYPVLLANGNPVAAGDEANGRHWATWQDPFKKPAYLFAVVAGKLDVLRDSFRTASGRDVQLAIYVEPGKLDQCPHAMEALKKSMKWDEERFGLECDLDHYMIVAVGDFNMGAMENKGLNIFNTKYVLARPDIATDVDFENIDRVVAHEYFHNWTGNRVTCRDWFQLSLKEGLTVFRDQEFSMDMAAAPSARAVCRIQDVRQLRAVQFPEDSGAMAHPVRPDSYVEINNFYTPTVYEKGSEVVRMYQTLVGRKGFEAGIKLYFERHDGQAVTCDDFAAAIADANPGSALSTRLEAFKRWYAQSGTPRVQARGHYDAAAQTFTLTLKQHHPATPGQPSKLPQVIPVTMGLLGREGQVLPLQLQGEAAPVGTERVLVLDEAEQTFVFTGVSTEPVPSLLRGFSAPVVLDDGLSDAELLVLLKHDADAFNRWEASQRLALNRILQAVRTGEALVLDADYIEAMRAVLRDPQLDAAFKELALTLPGEGYVAEQLDVVDPQEIHAAVEAAYQQLAAALADDWAAAYEAHQVKAGYEPSPVQSGQRALSNLALSMLVLHATRTGDTVWPGRAYQRFKDATNMTERLGALAALVNAHAELAEPALQRFHALFKHEALVVDKWFALQARASEDGGKTFARVKQLLQHPDFTLKNPNRARSLLASLCMFNPAAFHRSDAAGYVLWAEQVLALDGINPQLAGRVARAMDRWTVLAEPYRSAAREAIARVAAKPELSNDVREIVERALASDGSAA